MSRLHVNPHAPYILHKPDHIYASLVLGLSFAHLKAAATTMYVIHTAHHALFFHMNFLATKSRTNCLGSHCNKAAVVALPPMDMYGGGCALKARDTI